jgi:hypothetical protein
MKVGTLVLSTYSEANPAIGIVIERAGSRLSEWWIVEWSWGKRECIWEHYLRILS